MTGLLHEKEFSRKAFVAGGGALIVSVASAGSALAASGNVPFSKRTPADYTSVISATGQASVDTWLAITADNKVIVSHGEPEFAGTPTGILMLIGEELNITDISMMSYARVESWLNPTGGGGGSGGISGRSTGARLAAAKAHSIMLGMAATKLGVAQSTLTSSNGVISGGGKSVKFGDLMGGQMFNYTLTTAVDGGTTAIPGALFTKPVANYTLTGKLVRRIDIPAKVDGSYTYIHNVRVPGMWHGRRVRPHGAGANAAQNHYPLSVDPTSISHIPGSQVVQVKNWVGVVAPREYDAIQAAAQLKVVWKSDPKFGDGGSGNYWGWLRKAGDNGYQSPARISADQTINGGTDAALASAAFKVSATYKYHYNNFVPIGPHCAITEVHKDASGNVTGATSYVQGQGGFTAQANAVSTILFGSTARAADCRIVWYEGSSSYGGGQQVQAVEEATILSNAANKPVRLQWMRWDQTGWDSYGPSQMFDVTAGVDKSGNIVAMDWTGYGQAGTTIDTTLELIGLATWGTVPGTGGGSPSDQTVYNKGTWPHRTVQKTQPLYGGALKISALRAPNAPQTYFASEQIVDELAHAVGMDPISFRRQNIDGTGLAGQRWLSVMDGAVQASGWSPKVAASSLSNDRVVTGTGFGFGTFASSQVSVVANVQVDRKTGKITVLHVTTAQNNGITVNLEGVTTQMSGALIQGLSRAMWEQPTWDKERVTSTDWVTYPILRFKDTPTVTLVNVHPGEYKVVTPGDESQTVAPANTAAYNAGWLLTGSGEPPTTAVGSAVANAFFDATGARIRQTPLTPATGLGALKAAGRNA